MPEKSRGEKNPTGDNQKGHKESDRTEKLNTHTHTHTHNLYLKIITSLILCSFPGGSGGKKSAYNTGEPGSVPGLEDLLEKEMATHSSILAWRTPWTGSLAGYSPWDCKESDRTE